MVPDLIEKLALCLPGKAQKLLRLSGIIELLCGPGGLPHYRMPDESAGQEGNGILIRDLLLSPENPGGQGHEALLCLREGDLLQPVPFQKSLTADLAERAVKALCPGLIQGLNGEGGRENVPVEEKFPGYPFLQGIEALFKMEGDSEISALRVPVHPGGGHGGRHREIPVLLGHLAGALHSKDKGQDSRQGRRIQGAVGGSHGHIAQRLQAYAGDPAPDGKIPGVHGFQIGVRLRVPDPGGVDSHGLRGRFRVSAVRGSLELVGDLRKGVIGGGGHLGFRGPPAEEKALLEDFCGAGKLLQFRNGFRDSFRNSSRDSFRDSLPDGFPDCLRRNLLAPEGNRQRQDKGNGQNSVF